MAAAWLTTLLVALAPVGQVHACSCGPQTTPEAALASADAGFVGVVARVQAPESGGKGVEVTGATYLFAVEEVLKGGWQAGDVVQVASEVATCGVSFTVGQRWRVLTYLSNSRHVTSLCSANELLAEGVPIPESAQVSSGGPPMGLLVVAGASALLVAVSAWAFTRSGRNPSV
jgi:hypothetical protein